MNTTSAVDQTIFSNIPKSSLPDGAYSFGVAAAPPGEGLSNFNLWITELELNNAVEEIFAYYRDADGDRHAADDPAIDAATRPSSEYFLASELIAINGDCNDNNPTIHPGATEIFDDGIDQDCNGFDSVTPPVTPPVNPPVDNPGGGILEDD